MRMYNRLVLEVNRGIFKLCNKLDMKTPVSCCYWFLFILAHTSLDMCDGWACNIMPIFICPQHP